MPCWHLNLVIFNGICQARSQPSKSSAPNFDFLFALCAKFSTQTLILHMLPTCCPFTSEIVLVLYSIFKVLHDMRFQEPSNQLLLRSHIFSILMETSSFSVFLTSLLCWHCAVFTTLGFSFMIEAQLHYSKAHGCILSWRPLKGSVDCHHADHYFVYFPPSSRAF